MCKVSPRLPQQVLQLFSGIWNLKPLNKGDCLHRKNMFSGSTGNVHFIRPLKRCKTFFIICLFSPPFSKMPDIFYIFIILYSFDFSGFFCVITSSTRRESYQYLILFLTVCWPLPSADIYSFRINEFYNPSYFTNILSTLLSTELATILYFLRKISNFGVFFSPQDFRPSFEMPGAGGSSGGYRRSDVWLGTAPVFLRPKWHCLVCHMPSAALMMTMVPQVVLFWDQTQSKLPPKPLFDVPLKVGLITTHQRQGRQRRVFCPEAVVSRTPLRRERRRVPPASLIPQQSGSFFWPLGQVQFFFLWCFVRTTPCTLVLSPEKVRDDVVLIPFPFFSTDLFSFTKNIDFQVENCDKHINNPKKVTAISPEKQFIEFFCWLDKKKLKSPLKINNQSILKYSVIAKAFPSKTCLTFIILEICYLTYSRHL